MKRLIFTVSGRVQGVGFRYHVQRLAHAIGLTGFVRNLENGDVYIEAQGAEARLTEFRDAMTSKLSFARIRSIRTEEIRPIPDEPSFQIRS